MPSTKLWSRRSLITTTTLSLLGGSGGLLSGCGGGGGRSEGLLNYGSKELSTRAFGTVPSIKSSSGLLSTSTNVSLPGVATVVGNKSSLSAGTKVTIEASLDLSKAIAFVSTVNAEIASRISYGIDVSVSSLSDSGIVHLLADLPLEMQSIDPNTLVASVHLVFADSDGYMAVTSTVSADQKAIAVDIPSTAFVRVGSNYLAHLVIAEVPVTRKPGSRPVDYDPDHQQLLVLNPSGLFSFASSPLGRKIEIVSRVGMRESTTDSEPRKHVGVDLRIDANTSVLAVADGYITRLVDFNKAPTAQGNFISILHDGGYATQYLHLANFDDSLAYLYGIAPESGVWSDNTKSVRVTAGQRLGTAGNTSSVGVPPHLHFNMVPSGSAWTDSKNHYGVYNPEPLLQATLVKEQLIAEFLFGYEGKKYKTDDTIEMSLGAGKVGYINLYALDSVFRNLELPADTALKLEQSDTSIATVLVENGRLKITNKKVGRFEVKVVYTSSKQQPFAYGKVKINLKSEGYPQLSAYIADLCNINGQFRMGRTEVTAAMWKEYCAATNTPMPAAPYWGWIDNHPMLNVSWYDIMGIDGKGGYCAWASSVSGVNLSLPTASQWEFAATGGDGRNYPWGGYGPSTDDGKTYPGWDPSKCFGPLTSTAPVGTIPAGNSPFGCSDMAGNVAEFCLDSATEDSSYKMYKGGSWGPAVPDYFLCANRFRNGPASRYDFLGFRLSAGPK